MRKASKILCLIGGIVGIFLAILWLVLSIVYFVFGGIAAGLASDPTIWADLPNSVQEFFDSFIKGKGFQSWEEVSASLMSAGVLFLVMFMFSIPCAVISFIVRGKEKTGLPLPIVLVVLSWAGNIFSFVGGALAIVNWAVVERKE